jgi:hypothetical protein
MMKLVQCPKSDVPVYANSCKGYAVNKEFRCTKCGQKGHAEVRGR